MKVLRQPTDGAPEVQMLGRNDEVLLNGEEMNGYVKVTTARGEGWVKAILLGQADEAPHSSSQPGRRRGRRRIAARRLRAGPAAPLRRSLSARRPARHRRPRARRAGEGQPRHGRSSRTAPGAGGNLGADAVAKAPPDGSTIVMGAVATHAINPWLYAKLPYDPIRDFTPITGVAQVPNVLVMSPEVAARLGIAGVADLVAYARKNPGKLNYGSGGNGSAGHLAGEMFKSQAGVFMVHIPYAGGNPAQLALLAGQVDLNFDNLAAASANIKAGKLKALAVTTAKRSSAMPDVPTIAEAGRSLGLGSFDIDTWFGIFGPAQLPAEVTARLNKAFVDALESNELKARAGQPVRRVDGRPARPVRGVREERAGQVREGRQGLRGTDRIGQSHTWLSCKPICSARSRPSWSRR